MARAVKQVPATGRVEVKENAWHDNDLLVEASLEEVEAVRDGTGETLEVEPQVKGRVGHVADDEAHAAQAVDNVVALLAEMVLQRLHLLLHDGRVEHGDGGLLEGHVGAAVEVRAAGADAEETLVLFSKMVTESGKLTP